MILASVQTADDFTFSPGLAIAAVLAVVLLVAVLAVEHFIRSQRPEAKRGEQ